MNYKKKKNKSCFLTVFLIIVLVLVQNLSIFGINNAQVKFKHLTSENGLSQNSVNAISQDYLGFMWFGTNDGLNRYDGKSFKVYRNIHGNSHSLIDNNINFITEDSRKILWIGTDKGVSIYNREYDIFLTVAGSEDHFIHGFCELSDGKMYFLSFRDIFLYDPQKDSLQSIFNNGLSVDYDLFTGKTVNIGSDKFLIASKKGLFLLDGVLNKASEVEIVNVDNEKDLNFESLYIDSYGTVWAGVLNQGLFVLNLVDSGKFIFEIRKIEKSTETGLSLDSKVVKYFCEDNDRNLWIAAEDGVGIYIVNLSLFQKNILSIVNYKQIPGDKYSLMSNVLSILYKDVVGTMWVGHSVNGISYYNRLANKFETLEVNEKLKNGLNNNYVSSIYDEGDKLWLGTADGLNLYNKNTGTWKYYKIKNNRGTYSITVIFKDSEGYIWLGTWARGLHKLDVETGVITPYVNDYDDTMSLNNNNIFGIAEDFNGRIWVGTMGGGVNILDKATGTFSRLNSYVGENAISSAWIKNIITDKKGNIWIATGQGLNFYDTKTQTVKHYFKDAKDKNSLPTNSLLCVHEDLYGNIWVGTESGLCKYNSDTDNFTVYAEQDGLPYNVIRGLCDDKNGSLWISSNQGLTCFVNASSGRDLMRFEHYTVDDGLQGNEFNSRSCARSEDGMMYFGGLHGMTFFHPDSIPVNSTPPDILFTDFLIFNKSIPIAAEKSPLTKNINLTNEIVLNHHQSVLTFKYVALNFISPEKNAYKYMMKGFDKDWNIVGSKTEATYTNLNPGEYEFVVLGSNNDNVWNEKGASVFITILPPWWATLWFKIIVILLLLSIIIGFYYMRIGQLNRQKKILQYLVDKRTEELKKQASDLNIVNSKLEERQQRVVEQAKILKKQTSELSKKNQDLEVLNSTKDKFFSIIGHDLKNPFSSVIGISQLLFLKYDKYTDEKRKDLARMIFESAHRSFKLLENLLEWSRTQTGSIKYDPEFFFLQSVLVEIKGLVKSSLEVKKLELELLVPDEFEIYADKNMLTTVLRNLITNAVKFCDNGKITVSLDSQSNSDFHHINVVDQGVGMDEKQLESLFKIDKSNQTQGTRGEKGTGLGLIICKEFVEMHGGAIVVVSTLGEGSIFTIKIPKFHNSSVY